MLFVYKIDHNVRATTSQTIVVFPVPLLRPGRSGAVKFDALVQYVIMGEWRSVKCVFIELTEAEWRMYTSPTEAIIGSDNGTWYGIVKLVWALLNCEAIKST